MGERKLRTGIGFDGGRSHTDAEVLVPPDNNVPSVGGDLGPARLERLNRSPEFVQANGEFELARSALARAAQRQSTLEALQRGTSDSATRQKIQVQIASAVQETQRAQGAKVLAEQKREAVIKRVEEGEAIIVEDKAPPAKAVDHSKPVTRSDN